jgi:hypothetical protein
MVESDLVFEAACVLIEFYCGVIPRRAVARESRVFPDPCGFVFLRD